MYKMPSVFLSTIDAFIETENLLNVRSRHFGKGDCVDSSPFATFCSFFADIKTRCPEHLTVYAALGGSMI